MANPPGNMPDLPSDADDDEALRYAIALSLQDAQNSEPGAEKASDPGTKPEPGPGPEPGPEPGKKASFGSLFLDRKAMEEERLKRLAAKRPRPQDDEDDDVVEVPPPKRTAVAGGTHDTSSSMSPAKTRASPLPFVDGVVKKTWAYGYPRTSQDIKIEEVLRGDHLELAVLSSFQWDEEWLLSKVDVRRTKMLLIAYATDRVQQDEMRQNAPPNVRFCFPPMHGPGPGSMHSKLQLLKFADSMRLVVPTGNLVPYDWGETGVMENMVFLIDLPRLPSSAKHEPTSFSTEMSRFLRASGVDDKMVKSLENYDFSRTSRLGFVYSIPGSHTDELRRRTGYCGLGDCVSGLDLVNDGPVDVHIVAASLGSINGDFIGALYNACQGDNGMKEYNERIARKRGQKAAGLAQQLKDHVRIYFPSDQTVTRSRGGRGAAGTICVQSRWWRSPTFPTGLVRDCENVRPGLLMHSKMIFVRPSGGAEANGDSSPRPSWVYVGSANLSESAWGRLVKDSKTGKPKMNCRNWECGVVLPVTEHQHQQQRQQGPQEGGSTAMAAAPATGDDDDGQLLDTFRKTAPVPMRVPGRAYGPNEEPWFFMDTN